jgi:hypothetical protein
MCPGQAGACRWAVADIQVGMDWSVLVMVILIGWLLGGQVLQEMAPDQPGSRTERWLS